MGSLKKIFDLNFGLGPGGHLGIFLGGYVPPGTPNWHCRSKKISPKIDPVLEMGQFFIPPF